MDHREQVSKVNASWLGETDDDHRFIGGWYPPRGKRIRGIDRGYPLEVNIRCGELRANIVHIVRHSPQDQIHDGFHRIAARRTVTLDFLDPFEVDDRDDSDLQVWVLCN